MKRNRRVRRVLGFTLVEMVVVVAIIAVLVGVFGPAMMSYIRRSRIRAANADAKLVYNAAQTEVQRYVSIDRVRPSRASGFRGTRVLSYEHDSASQKKCNDVAANPLAAVDATTATGEAANAVIDGVNRVVSGATDVNWAVYVDNYIVKASVSAPFMGSRYIGCYTANKAKAMEMSDATYGTLYKGLIDGSTNMKGMTSSLVTTYNDAS